MGLAILLNSAIGINHIEAQYSNKWIQEGWVEAFCRPEGCTWVKKMGGTWPRIYYLIKASAGRGHSSFESDCMNWRFRAIGEYYQDGHTKWNSMLPDTNALKWHNVVCHPQFR